MSVVSVVSAAMAQEVCSLKAQLKQKEDEVAALKCKLAQLEKVRTFLQKIFYYIYRPHFSRKLVLL